MTNRRALIATEAQEQITFIEMVNLKLPAHISRMLFHIPNGGKRSKSEAARFKKMGVKPGIPDLFLAFPSDPYHGLFIEMKRKNFKPIDLAHSQKQYIRWLNHLGYLCMVANGADEAYKYLTEYYFRISEYSTRFPSYPT